MGFTKTTLDEKLKGQKSLLYGSIYGKKGPPTHLEEKLFQYSIDSIYPISKEKSHPQFWYKYENVVIDEGGDVWWSWSEKRSNYSYLLLSMKSVDRAVDLFMKHLGRFNQNVNNLKKEAQKN